MRPLNFAPAAFRFASLRSLLLALLMALCGLAWANPGDKITTTLTGFGGGTDSGNRVVIQSDGKPIVIGGAFFGTEQYAMTRYNTDGSIDTTYGTPGNGTQLEPLGSGNGVAEAATIDANGKLVVAGHVASDKDRFGIARFNADGTLDTTFGGGGSAISVGPAGSGGYAMVLETSSGKPLVGGYSIDASGFKVMTVVRYSVGASDSAQVDGTYGSGGAYVAASTGGDHVVTAMALQSDGKLVTAAGGGSDLVVQRLNTNGTLDTTFGSGGTATVAGFGASVADVAIYSDDRILVAGNDGTSLKVVRFSASGVRDSAFGSSGVASIASAQGVSAGGLVLLGNGSIVVSGTFSTSASSHSLMIARFTAAGVLDTTFGSSGKTLAGSADSSGHGIAQRPGGGFIVTGADFLPASSLPDTLAAAFDSAGHIDTTFGAGTGIKVADFGNAAAVANASRFDANGKLVVAGTYCAADTCPSLLDTTSAQAIVARYLPNGTLDTTFAAGKGWVKVPAMLGATALAIDASNRIVLGGIAISGTSTRAMAFARLSAAGALDTSFGSGGTFVVPPSTSHEEIASLLIQPSGRIVGAGFVAPGTFIDSVFVGVTANGALDGTFGTGGEAVVPISTGDDQIYGMTLDGAGRIVGVGWAELVGGKEAFAITRLSANGQLDTSGFANPNGYQTVAFTGNARAYGVAMQGTNMVMGGKAFGTSNDDFALARITPAGTLDTTFNGSGTETIDYINNHNRIFALAVLPSGKVVGAGEDFGNFGIVQVMPNGGLDASFGDAGNSAIPVNFMAGADFATSLNVAANGDLYLAGNASNAFGLAIVAGDSSGTATRANPTVGLASSANPSASGQAVTFTANVAGSVGTPTGQVTFLDGSATISGCASVALSGGVATCTTSALSSGSHSISASYAGNASYNAAASATLVQTVQSSTSSGLALSPASLGFGGESMGTTSPAQTVTITNNSAGNVSISGIATTAQFAQSNDCSTLAPGASCTVSVTFTPAAAGGAINSTVAVSGSLSVSSSAPGSPSAAALAGTAEKSLVTHYYRAILRRAPDDGGKAFWQGEAARVSALGADVNETWYAMALAFYGSAEYAAFGRDDVGFVTDLYNTFFNRAPDADGLNFWTGQIASGMPRGVVLVSFMFSPEFQNFSHAIFGDTSVRPEINTVVDFYRGVFGRLPDDSGYNFWLQQFRAGQCQGGNQVYATVNAISQSFLDSAEYSQRNRSNSEFVGDLYNTFLRRGADLDGVKFWINQLDSGSQTREQLRQAFVNSTEFNNRVQAIVAAGCAQ